MNANRRKQLDKVAALMAQASELLTTAYELAEEITDEEQDAFDNLPESLQDSDRGDTMSEAIDNLESLKDAITTATDAIEEADGYREEAQL